MDRASRPSGALDGLTALRFFAALLVMLFHYFTQYMPPPAARHGLQLVVGHGFSGVTFFFMLSGFILAYTYAEADFAAPGVLGRYLRARAARILPLYLLSLALAAPLYIEAVLYSPPGLYQSLYDTASVLAPLGLQAWVPGAAASINFPTWSVSNEAFFYLLFPLLLPALLLRPRRWLLVTAILTVAVWVATVWLWQVLGNGYGLMESSKTAPDLTRLAAQFIKFFPLCHVHEFVAGMLLFALWRSRAWRWPGVPLLAGGAVLFVALAGVSDLVPAPVDHNGLMVLPFSLLILGGANLGAGRGGLVVFLGKASYGMYLFHAPVYQYLCRLDQGAFSSALKAVPYLTEAVALALTVAVASALHLAVEEPLRRKIMGRSGPAAAAARCHS